MNDSATNQDYGTVVAPRTVRLERILPGPIERVWAWLTESDKRARWFAAGDMDLRVGGAMQLTWRNSELSPGELVPERYRQYEGVTMQGRITACEPPRLLAYTWGESDGSESEVRFELTPQSEDVRLVLTHSGLADRDAMVSVSGGWHSHLGVLVALLEDRVPGSFWAENARLEAEYQRRIPGDA